MYRFPGKKKEGKQDYSFQQMDVDFKFGIVV